MGIAAAVLGRTLSTLHVTIQGVGAVGFHVARLLTEHRARVTVADIDAARAQRAGLGNSPRTILKA